MNSLIRKWLGEDPEVTRFRVWMGIAVLWCLSGVMSCSEIKYVRQGETATATLVNSSNEFTRPIRATYRWKDSETGENRNKVLEIRQGFPQPEIEIQYIPGGLDSRPASAAAWLMPGIFLGMTALGIGWAVMTGKKDRRRVG
ncbi:MAG: hypothetical protein AAF911_09000 [Planctomycetota bacterium]